MTIDTLAPIPSLLTILRVLAEHAQANPTEDLVLIDEATTAEQRAGLTAMPLDYHFACEGWAPDDGRHLELINLQGWVRVTVEGASKWLVRADTPAWIMPFHLIDRCRACVRAAHFDCRCQDDVTPYAQRMSFIYVLELAGGRFYVGTSETPLSRIESHIAGTGAVWTRRHSPVRLHHLQQVRLVDAKRMEDRTTLDLVEQHGMSLVRGGRFQTRTAALRAAQLMPAWRKRSGHDSPLRRTPSD